MTNKPPTDEQKFMVVDEYQLILKHLKKLAFIQLVDGGACVRITQRGLEFMEATTELEDYNRQHPK